MHLHSLIGVVGAGSVTVGVHSLIGNVAAGSAFAGLRRASVLYWREFECTSRDGCDDGIGGTVSINKHFFLNCLSKNKYMKI